jgi:hypothetical protein
MRFAFRGFAVTRISHTFSDSPPSSAFSPTLFVGEKVAKPDDGVFDRREERVRVTGQRPHPNFGTFFPRKARGEKALDGRESLKSVRNAG